MTNTALSYSCFSPLFVSFARREGLGSVILGFAVPRNLGIAIACGENELLCELPVFSSF